jgi:lincosamide nucleotidyltransferase A/C/D/E
VSAFDPFLQLAHVLFSGLWSLSITVVVSTPVLMTSDDVVGLWSLFQESRLDVTIDGGWAVDAVLERQTREHGDLDIAIPHSQLPALVAELAKQGFGWIASGGSWECNFVLADVNDRRIDIHSYELDPEGNNRFGVPYAASHLEWWGVIGGVRVRSVPPEWQVKFHVGYDFDDTDRLDVRALCDRFEIPVPDQYRDSCC